MYEVRFTTQFKKDLKLAQKQKHDLEELFVVIDTLAKGDALDSKYRDHELIGKYAGARECHIEPNWLLIYEILKDSLILMFYRLGTHSELFK